VYRTKANGEPARQDVHARVGDDAFLVFCPDPLVPFARSDYIGTQRFDLSPSASLVAVDWLAAGRSGGGERWAFQSYSSRTEVASVCGVSGSVGRPALIEALCLPPRDPAARAECFDVGNVRRDASVSVIARGPRARPVAERLLAAAAVLAQRRSSHGVRDAREGIPSTLEALGSEASLGERLLGDVVMGVCEMPCSTGISGTDVDDDARAEREGTVTVARLVAEHNEVGSTAPSHECVWPFNKLHPLLSLAGRLSDLAPLPRAACPSSGCRSIRGSHSRRRRGATAPAR
jgi:hypothetical protein